MAVRDDGSGEGASQQPSSHGHSEELRRWELLLRHRDHAVTVVRRKYGNPAEAEDCVHDAMLRLVRRADLDLDPERVHSLLTRAALGIAIDHRRRARRAERAVVRLAGGAAAQVVSPEEVLADRADAQRVLAAVDTLPRRERQVFLLRHTGLSVAETARLLDLSYKSIEGAYTRARARIRLAVGALLAWIAARLRRVSEPQGEAAVVAVAALLFAAPFWGGAPPHGGPGGDRQRHGGTAGLASSGGHGGPGDRGGGRGDGGGGNGGGQGGHAGGGSPFGLPPSRIHTIASVPIDVRAPGPHGGIDILNTGITITGGPVKDLHPVAGVKSAWPTGRGSPSPRTPAATSCLVRAP